MDRLELAKYFSFLVSTVGFVVMTYLWADVLSQESDGLYKKDPVVNSAIKLYEEYSRKKRQDGALTDVYDAKKDYYVAFVQKSLTLREVDDVASKIQQSYPQTQTIYFFNAQDLTKIQVYNVKTKRLTTLDIVPFIYFGLCKEGHRLSVDATKNFVYSYYLPEEKTVFLFLNREQARFLNKKDQVNNLEQAVKEAINLYGNDSRIVAVEVGGDTCVVAENGKFNYVTLPQSELKEALNQGIVQNTISKLRNAIDNTFKR